MPKRLSKTQRLALLDIIGAVNDETILNKSDLPEDMPLWFLDWPLWSVGELPWRLSQRRLGASKSGVYGTQLAAGDDQRASARRRAADHNAQRDRSPWPP